MTNMTFKEWKKKYPFNYFFKKIKNEEEYQNLKSEVKNLTQEGNRECVYEFAQMENCDMDDIYDLIRE